MMMESSTTVVCALVPLENVAQIHGNHLEATMADAFQDDVMSHSEHEHSTGFMYETMPSLDSSLLSENVNDKDVPMSSTFLHEPVSRSTDNNSLNAGEQHEFDEENHSYDGPLVRAEFHATCRLAARLGALAMNYGSIAENIEPFLAKLMSIHGYYGFFSCSTFEISCNFEMKQHDDSHQELVVRTQNVQIEAGSFQLTKLGLVSDLAKDLMEQHSVTMIHEANQRLDEIESSPDPWGTCEMAISFVIIGGTLPTLLGGTWKDCMAGPFSGAIAYSMCVLFAAWPSRVHLWLNVTSSFLCSLLGCTLHYLVWSEIDPTIVTLSGVAILIPSATITLGINDLASSHVASGFERLVKGIIIILWLAVGYLLGMTLGESLFEKYQQENMVDIDVEPVPMLWQFVFLPILCASVSVIFQMTGKDMVYGCLGMILGYATSFISVFFFDLPYLGPFMASVAVSAYANLFSRYFDRPNTIILFPGFQLVVAGITGYMGLTELVTGEGPIDESGSQVLHMLVVAAIVVAGFLVGGTVVQPYTTI